MLGKGKARTQLSCTPSVPDDGDRIEKLDHKFPTCSQRKTRKFGVSQQSRKEWILGSNSITLQWWTLLEQE